MSPDSPRQMQQPGTVTRETPPSSWTEVEKCQYLLDINERENPAAVERLRYLIRMGRFADEIAELCDEYGHLVYTDRNDPNALINRFDFVNIGHPSFPEKEEKMTVTLDESFYLPLVTSIHQTRELVALASRNTDIMRGQPRLTTHEDYMEYFSSFPAWILESIIMNLAHIEITRGCNGPCRSVCCAMPESRATEHMPYLTVIWLIDKFMELTGNRGAPPMLYYANDMADYRYGDKTAIHLFQYLLDRYRYRSSLSTAYSLSSATVDFLYGCVTMKKQCRISRLATGNRPDDFDRLWGKIVERAARDGVVLDEDDKKIIESGFMAGNKTRINDMAGAKITKDTQEHEMSQNMFACRHGVVMKTGEGFHGIVMRPTSKRFPAQQQSFPIVSNSEVFTIPALACKGKPDGFFRPLSLDGEFVAAPVLLKLHRNGTVLSDETLTLGQQRLYILVPFKRWMNTMRNTHMTMDPAKFCHEVTEFVKIGFPQLRKALEDDLEGQCEVEKCLVILAFMLRNVKKHAASESIIELDATMRLVTGHLSASQGEMSPEQVLEKWYKGGHFHELGRWRQYIGAPGF